VPSALIVARRVCADASALDAAQLARSTASLTTANIVRRANGEWRWQPVPSASLDRRPTDNEIAGRVGAILFECLTATGLPDYLPEAGDVASRLRDHRPDLPQAVVNLVGRLAAARSSERLRLEDVANDVQRAIPVQAPAARRSTAGRWVTGALLVLGGVAVWRAGDSRESGRLGTHGLTEHETVLHDLATESADFLAVGSEHTAALDHLKELERLWRERVASEDPRVGLNYLRQAWVRAEAGDFLTAEQILVQSPTLVGRALGNDHPYVRLVRLNLAGVLDRRQATDDAREQRAAARAAAERLLPASVVSTLEESPSPPAPGVIAHLAPNAPEREGFRRDANGGFVSPVTSAARWLAGRDGWRLHVGATETCRAAVDAGSDPHRLQVAVERQDEAWRVIVDGLQPRVDLSATASPSGRAAVTVDVMPTGDARVMVPGADALRAVVDPDAVSNPPYGLTFAGTDGDQGCTLVWWEVKPHS
jgi:hypothetical protein